MNTYTVTLKQSQGGFQFTDTVEANNINQARSIAESRNPGAQVLSVR